MSLMLRGEGAPATFDALCTELSDLNSEIGLPLNAVWIEAEEIGKIWPEPLVTTDEDEQLAWLALTSDRLVTALRPRLSAFAG